MTILPKKKSGQPKNNANANSSNDGGDGGKTDSGVVGLHHGGQHSSTDNRAIFPGRNSPPRGWPPPGSREEKRPSAPSAFDEYDTLESGPSHSKRRHRASPHRSLRNSKHRSTNVGVSGGSTCLNLPSTSVSSSSGSSLSSGNKSPPETTNDDGVQDVNSEDYSGYNSGDEYMTPPHLWLTEEEWSERERIFEKKLRKKGFIIKKMGEDGACLFRAVADQVYGDQEMHSSVRRHCMDYMAKNSDYFSQYITEDFDTYVNRKRLDHIHGNHVEMQALSEMYNRTMEVYHYSTDPINIIRGGLSTDNEPIRISYHKNTHYNSIVDPHKATIGVGLGLPELVPGVSSVTTKTQLADKNLMCDAIRQSEDLQLEQAMLEDKLKATDWEATNEAIEEQVARESYLQWLRDNEKRARKQGGLPRSATATSSSSLASSAMDVRSPGNRSPRNRSTNSAGNSPARTDHQVAETSAGEGSNRLMMMDQEGTSGMTSNLQPSKPDMGACAAYLRGESGNAKSGSGSQDFSLLETASFMNQLPPDVFGLSEWEDADILAQVLAASQQEYLDSLKRVATAKENEAEGSTS